MEALRIILLIIYHLLDAFSMLMLVSAILSWIPPARESKFYAVIERIIGPILNPIRRFLFRFEWVRRCPIDLSFLVLVLIVGLASSCVGILYNAI
ncbi:MAG: YggT family protein [Clostridia bacterium]|nr:YggT family protein [Clostridia bacterium]